MSSDTKVNVYERIFKLLSSIFKMVVDGVREPEKLADALQAIIDTATTYLHQLYVVEIGATLGWVTLASSGLFTGGVYGVDVSGVVEGSTAPTNATVWEQILDGIFAKLFGSLGEARRRWTQGQVVEFCRVHPGKLRKDGYGTFFELEGGFVADVLFGGSGRLEVHVFKFSDGIVWLAEYRHRLVSLQLAA